MKKLILALVVAFGVVSCGSDTKPADTTTTTTTETVTEEAPAVEETQVAGSNEIRILGFDNMKYDKTEFTVKVGEEITLWLRNDGELPAEAMSHNVVVLKPGTGHMEFSLAGLEHADKDYISPDQNDVVVAKTKMLGPDQEDTITFTINEAGVYPFVCTFPGHAGSMNGTITAE